MTSASPRNVTFNTGMWSFLVSTKGYQLIITFPLRRGTLPKTTCLCFSSLSAFENLSLSVTLWSSSLSARVSRCCLIQEPFNNANQIFKIYSIEVLLLNKVTHLLFSLLPLSFDTKYRLVSVYLLNAYKCMCVIYIYIFCYTYSYIYILNIY